MKISQLSKIIFSAFLLVQVRIAINIMETMKKSKPQAIFLQESHFMNSNNQQQIRQPIRINADFSSLEKQLSSQQIDKYRRNLNQIKSSLFPLAINYLEQRLKVTPIKKFFIPQNQKNCFETDIPGEHIEKGLDADFVIYVSAFYNPAFKYMSTSSICLILNTDNNRPIAGQVLINLDRMKDTIDHFELMVNLLIHEIIHLLGFSSNMFNYFVDENGKARGLENIIKQEFQRGRVRKFVVTPEVQRIAREHYNCSTISGAELEDNGEQSIVGDHWESMTLNDEIMAGRGSQNAVLSKFTLALLKDSGWYDVDYSKAMTLHFGKGQGCEFITNSCNSKQKFREFCYGNELKSICDAGYDNKARCVESRKTKSETCRLVGPYSNGNCRDPDNQNNNAKYSGEEYGPKSKCLMNNIIIKGRFDDRLRPGCYQASCESSQINIFVHGIKLVCTQSGQKVHIEAGNSYSGFIICPDFRYFCANFQPECPNYCSGKGNCHNGKCECLPSYTGHDCSVITGCKNDCSGHGKCMINGFCRCDQGWRGNDCSHQSMETNVYPYYKPKTEQKKYLTSFKVKEKCQNNCNGNGMCENEACKCSSGWSGKFCKEKSCINNCNNKGQCQDGKCVCKQGWSGKECLTSMKNAIDTQDKILAIKCIKNCNGNGQCIRGFCKCKQGWEREDCSQKIVSTECPNECSGNGICNPQSGLCQCKVGYLGQACDQKEEQNNLNQEKKDQKKIN